MIVNLIFGKLVKREKWLLSVKFKLFYIVKNVQPDPNANCGPYTPKWPPSAITMNSPNPKLKVL
jgi:hypothetical protein